MRPLVMGVLNVTPDSFSDGGRYLDFDAALAHGFDMVAAGADVVRSQAERAGATITEVEGSHVIMISQPQAVTDVIVEALAAVKTPVAVG